MMVILRLSVGSHFLYEGVWKIKHPEFSAEGFLTQAKGPAAWIFCAMVPDMDGRERLKIEKLVSAQSLIDRWKKVLDDSESRLTAPYRKELASYDQQRKKLEAELRKKAEPSKKDEATAGKPEESGEEHTGQEVRLSEEDEKAVRDLEQQIGGLTREFRRSADPVFWEHEDKLEALLAENEKPMLAYFEARSQRQAAGGGKGESAEEVKRWLSAINDLQNQYFAALKDFAQKDKATQNAVGRSVAGAAPVFDEGTAADKLVDRGRLRDPKGQEVLRVTRAIRTEKFYEPWRELKQRVVRKYGLDAEQQADAERIYRRYKEAVKSALAENQADIAVYFQALDRYEQKVAAGNHGAAHQKQRLYDQQQKLRQEVGVWLAGLKATQQGYQNALASLLTPEQLRQGDLPVAWTRLDLINFAVTYGLTAIGLCLLLGLFTRPAAIAGGLFMFSVVLTQPAWPTIYPPDLPVVGHALLINKDFVEMIALFTLAATAVGRWGGLDYFVENFVFHLLGWDRNKTNDEKKESRG
jgi:uncharacterized membrane protein YphA (DoxX/SURF4 family)